MKGVILKYIEEKGFGFIKSENKNEKDIFFHIKSFSRKPNPNDLTPGRPVTFEKINGSKGSEANTASSDKLTT